MVAEAFLVAEEDMVAKEVAVLGAVSEDLRLSEGSCLLVLISSVVGLVFWSDGLLSLLCELLGSTCS